MWSFCAKMLCIFLKAQRARRIVLAGGVLGSGWDVGINETLNRAVNCLGQ